MKNSKALFILVAAASLFCFGCGQNQNHENAALRINNYTMSVADLADEIEHSSYSMGVRPDLDEIIDLAIKKQVLIQEAQRRGLDRKKTFMKSIERYWEQTLIRELLDEENKRIYENESESEREKALNDWVEGLQKKAKVKIYKGNLKALEEARPNGGSENDQAK